MKKYSKFKLTRLLKGKVFITVLLVVAFASVSVLLIKVSKKVSTKVITNLKTMPYQPLIEKTIDDDFKAELLFNNVANEKPFTPLIIEQIKNAKTDIKLAMYSIDSDLYKNELYEAVKRGVNVEVVLSINKKSQHDVFFDDAPKQLKIYHVGSVESNKRNLMHHKFVVIDHKLPSRTLIMGAFNWTQLQELFDPSFILKTQDENVVNVYLAEFERLKNKQTGKVKFNDVNYRPWQANFSYNNGSLELWWSPGILKNTIKQRLLDKIYSATASIDVMIWQLSDDDVVKAFRKKAQEGVKIRIITDDFNAWRDASKIQDLIKIGSEYSNFEVIDDAARTIDFGNQIKPYLNEKNSNFNSFLHHHVAIIDGQTLIAGTNNWSYSADYKNDESAFLTTIKELVDEYQKTFDYHYDQLHKQTINVAFIDNKFTIGDLDKWKGKKLVILGEDVAGVKNPKQCFEQIVVSDEVTWDISTECKNNAINFYILDSSGQVWANKLIGIVKGLVQ